MDCHGLNYLKDPMLEYFHKKHVEFNSSVTIYGEKHGLEYIDFLHRYVDALYLKDRKQIIILEKNESDLMSENKMFQMFMLEHPEKNTNIIRKKMGTKMAPTPILYFSAVYKHGGLFPDTEIICGDIRLRKIWDLITDLEEITKANDENIVDIDFLTRFKSTWQEQLAVLNAPEYLVIIDEIKSLLSELVVTMANGEIEKISNKLNEKWINMSNTSMVQYVKKHIKDGVDIVLFVGALHNVHLIEEISHLFPMMVNEVIDMDTDSAFSHFWFRGRTRLESGQIEADKFYDIRFKNGSGARLGKYKLKGFNGGKIILDDTDTEQTREFDSSNIYAYVAC